MISRGNLKVINYTYENIKNKPLFIKELMKVLKKYETGKLSSADFEEWLFSWEATAELDRDPKIALRVNRAYREIRTKKNNPRGWDKFKRDLGLI